MIVKESDQTFLFFLPVQAKLEIVAHSLSKTGDRTKQQQLQGVYQILDTEPYLYENRGQTRHARGPVHDSSVSCNANS